MNSGPSAILRFGDFSLRVFILLGLIGLPLLLAEWLGWWSAEGWIRTGLSIWLFIFGIGLFLVAACVAVGTLLIVLLVVNLWFSLLLGCLGFRPAMQNFHDTCSKAGNLLIALGQPLKSLKLSFPLDDHEPREG